MMKNPLKSNIATRRIMLVTAALCAYCALLPAQTEAQKQLATYAAHIGYFNQLCPQEKVYLHLDNTAYFQGETIWYAATVVNASTLDTAASKVLYVELLSPTGVVLKQQKLKVVDGCCHGSFTLIDNAVQEAVEKRGAIGYPSGYYQIRAYTRAMLNFDDAGIFSRVIPVYKAPDEEGNYADPIMRRYNGKETNRPHVKKTEKPDRLNLAFYPEGGHLISGVPCRIAFKATDQQGHGVDIESLTDEQGHTFALSPQHGGMGSFVHTTAKGEDKLTAMYGGKPYTFRLPEAEEAGCALQLHVVAADSLAADVILTGELADSLLGYTVTSQGKLCAFDTLAFHKSRQSIGFSTAKLPTGVTQLTLYGTSGVVYAQRLFFVDNGFPTVPLTITADKDIYHPFDEVKLRLQTATDTPATFSLAVRDAADYGSAYRDDIRTYMLLSSELKGLIEDPAWYFSNEELKIENGDLKNGEWKIENRGSSESHKACFNGRVVTEENVVNGDLAAHESPSAAGNYSQFSTLNSQLNENCQLSKSSALDLLMMVQGWTRYDWRKMAGVEPFPVRHYTEEQLVVDGWAFSRIKETPLANTKIFVRMTSLDRKHKQETTVTTDSLGYWSVGVEDFEGEWDLYMETRQAGRNGEKRTTRIRMERSSAPEVYAYDPIDTYLPAYTWSIDSMLTVKEAEDSEFKLPTDAHLLDEVVVNGKRKYVDYCTFHAFDAEKDAELIIDAGQYTYHVEDYLREKGYGVGYSQGDAGDSWPDDYIKELVCAATINNIRTLWYVHEGKRNLTSRTTTAGYALDIEEVKSIIFYDNPHQFMGIPEAHEVLGPSIVNYAYSDGLHSAGLYVVDIELNPSRKRRTYVDKNARATSFKGYDNPVEFYAPTYPNGPVQGDKDYRRTIYWNPEVKTDADGVANVSFYNNGYSLSLTVSAEGLTADGIPVLNR